MLEHALMAWRYVSELPQWDTANHNALREQCYGILAANCLSALQHYQPAASRGRELLRRYVSKESDEFCHHQTKAADAVELDQCKQVVCWHPKLLNASSHSVTRVNVWKVPE